MDREIHLVPISLLSFHAGVSGVRVGSQNSQDGVVCNACIAQAANWIF